MYCCLLNSKKKTEQRTSGLLSLTVGRPTSHSVQSMGEKSLPLGCYRAVGRSKLWVGFPGVRLLNN